MFCSVLQCVAVFCKVLQCVAVCYSVLQQATMAASEQQHRSSVLQCVAVCCSVLQCVAVCCSALQCGVICCSVLQCAASVAAAILIDDTMLIRCTMLTFNRHYTHISKLCSFNKSIYTLGTRKQDTCSRPEARHLHTILETQHVTYMLIHEILANGTRDTQETVHTLHTQHMLT